MGREYIRQIMVVGTVPYYGPVILFDDMEYLFKWTKIDGAGDSVFEKNAVTAFNGSYSLHMKTRTTAAAENDEISGYRKLFQRPGKRYQVEALIMIDSTAGAKYEKMQALINDASYLHEPGLRYDAAGAKWQYMNEAGAWTDITGGSQKLVADAFHRVTMKFNEVSGEYISFCCDSLEVLMTGVKYYKEVSAAACVFRLDIGLTAGATPPGEIYVDDVFVMEI